MQSYYSSQFLGLGLDLGFQQLECQVTLHPCPQVGLANLIIRMQYFGGVMRSRASNLQDTLTAGDKVLRPVLELGLAQARLELASQLAILTDHLDFVNRGVMDGFYSIKHGVLILFTNWRFLSAGSEIELVRKLESRRRKAP